MRDGQKTVKDANSLTNAVAKFTCRVDSVTRYADGG